MYGEIPTGSLLDHLSRIPDGRSRQGRTLPLASMLGLLILAALNGETSLLGMWMWGRNDKPWLPSPLKGLLRGCGYGIMASQWSELEPR
ncbi:MAG: transposase family protein [Anaerolineae bacterium]|nr:transposase family protein [Anaerolineae bacterium]